MELMERVPLKELGESELERLLRDWRRVDCRDEGKHTGNETAELIGLVFGMELSSTRRTLC